MAVHKLHIEDFEEDDYHIIAIHTSLEEYRLAYFLNRDIEIKLSKNHLDILLEVKEGTCAFERFTFKDIKKDITWNLIQNKNNVKETLTENTMGLFSNSGAVFSIHAYLIPEFKKVDFFLKIANVEEELNIPEIVAKINAIKNVTLVYSINKEKIKSKNNLIF
ncbi:IPExxxVDY family protein [Flavobacterium aciduliphilum]|uniref:IPExxxVDY family protein n=1 Tax=Flavobacterium aciduliphilum TaxID=1101402 RepID=A0A328YMR3_9FLAO|nr:IPExxxVDY family protein [Flavobacterium aciduliphilum]RAR71376.1 hypothetical protein CLV55_108113 [Flavobacterium aciduliphilum]